MQIDTLHIKNYKCFDEQGCIVDHINLINVIIGKNNSGKSSLIEALRFIALGDQTFHLQVRNGKEPEIIFYHKMVDKTIDNSFPNSISGGKIGINHNIYGKKFIGSKLTYKLLPNNKKIFVEVEKEIIEEAKNYFNAYAGMIKNDLQHKFFSQLAAERDIVPETPSSKLDISTTGVGATSYIQQIITKEKYNSDLIEKKLLAEINKIVNPEIEFSRILVKQNDINVWEIYFESLQDGLVPLSKMGSGIKTILLVLLLLHVKPTIEARSIDQYIFAFEELENNLHPSLQRNLYYYIYEFSKKNGCIFFLTTHSSIVIDLFNSLTETQIFHINREYKRTEIKSMHHHHELKRIFDDLDVKASDILQSNGVVWVEGPSDRNYLTKWISLLDKSLIEGYHYSVMFYGGRLLSNLSFDNNFLNAELIPLLKLNKNSFVIIDRDGKGISTKLNETKNRIQKELGEDSVWITKGREIENYFHPSTVIAWLSHRHGIKVSFTHDANMKLEEQLYKRGIRNIKYNLHKNKYSSEIVNFFDEKNLEILDLKLQLNKIIKSIKSWNRQSRIIT